MTTFDRALHQTVGGTRIEPGARVVVIRRGDVATIDGEQVDLSKAVVEPVTDAEVAAWRSGAQTWLADLQDALDGRASADAVREVVARGPSLTAGPDLPYLMDALGRAAGDRVKLAAALRKARTALDTSFPQPALAEAQLLRAAARERNRLIESSRGTAKLLERVDELISKGAAKGVIRQDLDPALAGPEQVYAGADLGVIETLRTALDAGDLAKLRAAVTRAGTKVKLKGISKAGAKTKFDPETMDGVGGITIPDGAAVTVVRRGTSLTLPDGQVMQLTRAQVTPVVKAAPARAPRVAPTKAQPTAVVEAGATRAAPIDLTAQSPADLARSLGGRGLAEDRDVDDVLAAIARHQGFDGPPTVVTTAEFERLAKAAGARVQYRAQAGAGDLSAADIHEQFRSGEYRAARGFFGSGTYVTDTLGQTVTRYGDGTPGSVLRLLIKPDAKRISLDDLREQIRAWRTQHGLSLDSELGQLLKDPGRFAAARG